MVIKDFIEKMNELCPLELQEEWDNSGIQINSSENVQKVLVALDVSKAVVEEALTLGVDMIVTHHPLFFGGFKKIIPEMLPTRYALELIKNGISVYSTHTNFDIMEGGNNDYLGTLIGFEDVKPSEANRFLRLGKLPKEMSLKEDNKVSSLITLISEKLDIEKTKIRIIGNPDANVETIAWCTGAGSDFLFEAMDCGADLFITGDVKYHEATDISEFGFNCLDIGHFGSEKIFTPNMTNLMISAFPDIEIIPSKVDKDPFVNI